MSAKSPARALVTRRFDAPAERVFDAWTTVQMIPRWMFGPVIRDEEVLRISIDARVGGKFSFLVRRQGQEIDHIGQYIEIDRPRRLVFTWAVAPNPIDSSSVAIDIVELASGCEFTLTHELHPDWADFAKRTEEGWTRMLDMLAKALA